MPGTAKERSDDGHNLSHRLAGKPFFSLPFSFFCIASRTTSKTTKKTKESGCYKGWKFLLGCLNPKEQGILLSTTTSTQDTALAIACREQNTTGHVQIIKSILSDKYKKYCDVNASGVGGRRAIYRACQMNHVHAVKLVLSAPDIIPNPETDNRWTPCAKACDDGSIDMAQTAFKLQRERKKTMPCRAAPCTSIKKGTHFSFSLSLKSKRLSAIL